MVISNWKRFLKPFPLRLEKKFVDFDGITGWTGFGILLFDHFKFHSFCWTSTSSSHLVDPVILSNLWARPGETQFRHRLLPSLKPMASCTA